MGNVAVGNPFLGPQENPNWPFTNNQNWPFGNQAAWPFDSGQLGPVITTVQGDIPTYSFLEGVGFDFQATGGVAPYAWSVASGSLPDALTLDSDGHLHGTITDISRAYPITIRCTGDDSNYTDKDFVINVTSPDFLDLFSGSASDPSLDATKWTQNTIVGGTVNDASNGLCKTSTGASIGQFVGFVSSAFEGGSDDTIEINDVVYNGAASRMELYLRAENKTAKDRDGGGNTGTSYFIYLTRGAGGASVQRLSGSSFTPIGSSFELTNIADGNPHDISVRVRTLADRVRFNISIDNVEVAQVDDTDAGRKTIAGYTGFVQVSFLSTTSMSAFMITDNS